MSNSKIFHSGKGEDDEHAYHTPLEHKVKGLIAPFQEFINSQATASVFLLLCTLAALIWASIPVIATWYTNFVTTSIGFHISDLMISKPLRFWVNDGLITLFFFFIGLEIKWELLVGELTDHKRAVFILFAAIGGMLTPATIYFVFHVGSQNQSGWAIPMATDTAFALGILSCFKNRIPKGVFTFLAALAIIDDIGAIIVIAICYTAHLNIWMLLIAFFLAVLLILCNYAGFRKPWLYIIIGLLIWAAIEEAGVHGSISGILVAFTIPARPGRGPRQFIKHARELLNRFEIRKEETALILEDQKQHAALEEVQEVAQQATTPLQRWESKLALPITLFVLPLFALVNAGIPIDLHLIDNVFTHRVSLGIILALVIGKPSGVLLFSRIALWFKLGIMLEETTFKQLIGAAVLTGIGFTMSLFILNLSFSDSNTVLIAKAAILISSVLAGLIGILFILLFNK
ncbi:MAG: Na+/H+ antiporter NhaA [Gammaproteobacteria bacterium CG_4_10_14_0_8_um_filter_38_16]|nr:MAG: Na+/H+ antiporter NhaA [Gammaproteobacteria bacterium CG_4_10_14_0_8_um_filter_38_16]PJA02816.1 MAG: Na+/H+ antiporter NhaA [Gammaproteobacteria bacterium CG_4_10_14_0_2_um_filter_38_22]PJB09660.1 MAG: Na+/H+ antiporter NhaA [Gammaproteobacteria bacterium CG_4_9_14_3_um_filter_38_9]